MRKLLFWMKTISILILIGKAKTVCANKARKRFLSLLPTVRQRISYVHDIRAPACIMVTFRT